MKLKRSLDSLTKHFLSPVSSEKMFFSGPVREKNTRND